MGPISEGSGASPWHRSVYPRRVTPQAKGRSHFGFRLENLTAAVHAGLEVDVVGTAQFARILIFHIGRLLQGVGGATHATSRRRRLFLRDSHGWSPCSRRNTAVRSPPHPTLGARASA